MTIALFALVFPFIMSSMSLLGVTIGFATADLYTRWRTHRRLRRSHLEVIGTLGGEGCRCALCRGR